MGSGAEDLDVGLLLKQALDDQPPPDLPERVVTTVALLATGIELFRLASEAPLSPLEPARPGPEPKEGKEERK